MGVMVVSTLWSSVSGFAETPAVLRKFQQQSEKTAILPTRAMR